jgi:hypothetical protein
MKCLILLLISMIVAPNGLHAQVSRFFYAAIEYYRYTLCTVRRGYFGQISAFSLNLNDIRVRIDLKVTSMY